MAWITPTQDDLTATLSAEEVDAFGGSAGFSDAVGAILARTSSFVRGFVRAGRTRLAQDAGAIPPSLLAPAMDYAAYDLLKRLNVPVSEDRRRARQDAVAIFEKVADRRLSVEPPDDADASSEVPASPSSTAPCPPRMLD